jgi:hypothetical protein
MVQLHQIQPPGKLQSTLLSLKMHFIHHVQDMDIMNQLQLGGVYSTMLAGLTPAALDEVPSACVVPRKYWTKPTKHFDWSTNAPRPAFSAAATKLLLSLASALNDDNLIHINQLILFIKSNASPQHNVEHDSLENIVLRLLTLLIYPIKHTRVLALSSSKCNRCDAPELSVG